MLTDPALAEWLSFFGAVLLAATVSASARGLSGHSEDGLRVFRKFYVDLVGAFAGLAFLSAGGPTSWTTSPVLGRITHLEGTHSLLPIAFGLFLIALLIARHRWGSRTKRADLMVTLGMATVIAFAVVGLTSRPSAGQSFDGAANRVFSSYCSGHSSDVARLVTLSEMALDNPHQSDSASDAGSPKKSPASSQAETLLERVMPTGGAFVKSGISQRTIDKTQGEFCDAVVMYLALRTVQDSPKRDL